MSARKERALAERKRVIRMLRWGEGAICQGVSQKLKFRGCKETRHLTIINTIELLITFGLELKRSQ